MKLNFSGSGNTEYIAKLIADGLGDEYLHLLNILKVTKDFSKYNLTNHSLE
ncbi:flavodoxin family protein [Clostridium thermarum]|uniref:flavodoxin family protein n=1 Tax=Clostridium thermarum TaxID=1716543 RepID=UPI0013D304AA|nr:hypothetical protein [Clostridium thermarum]